jgi:single-strand DNA-binding protein
MGHPCVRITITKRYSINFYLMKGSTVMAYLNEVRLIGNLGKTPEVRYLPNGDAVVNIGLATTKKYKDRDGTTTKERTEWHSLVVYGALAEIFGKYLRRGSQIYVAGELRTRKWTDSHQIDRYTTEIVVENMQMLDTRRDDAGDRNVSRHSHDGNQTYGHHDMPDDALPPPAGEEYPPTNTAAKEAFVPVVDMVPVRQANVAKAAPAAQGVPEVEAVAEATAAADSTPRKNNVRKNRATGK